MSSIVATTLKIALHRWINHRVASCAVELAIPVTEEALQQGLQHSMESLLKIVLQSTVIG